MRDVKRKKKVYIYIYVSILRCNNGQLRGWGEKNSESANSPGLTFEDSLEGGSRGLWRN